MSSRKFFNTIVQKTKPLQFFLIVVLCCTFALVAASFLPQEAIRQNLSESLPRLIEEGSSPYLYEYTKSSRLDNWSESLILAEAFNMNSKDLTSVFTNPRLTRIDDSYILSLQALVEDDVPPDITYVRYWMGFRVTVRLLLCFFNLAQIRRILCAVFFSLLAAVILSLAKHTNNFIAFAFSLSMILVSPEVICCSMQYTCCFLIAFAGMLLAPYVSSHKQYTTYYFMALGIATMYFDFYTTPSITFVLPILYLLLLNRASSENSTKASILFSLKSAAIWLSSYVGMWVAKLALTSIFTDVNGFGDGIGAFFSRIGIEKEDSLSSAYNPIRALLFAGLGVCDDVVGAVLCGIFFIAVLTAWFVIFKRANGTFEHIKENLVYLVVLLIPIIWLMVSAQPTVIHYGYQHRTLVGTFFAAFVFLIMTLVSAGAPIVSDKRASKPLSAE